MTKIMIDCPTSSSRCLCMYITSTYLTFIFTKFFAYPFGQKETCYNSKTNKIINKLGANAIFSNNPLNFNTDNNFFHRIPMASRFNNNDILISHLVLIRFKQVFYWNKF